MRKAQLIPATAVAWVGSSLTVLFLFSSLPSLASDGQPAPGLKAGCRENLDLGLGTDSFVLNLVGESPVDASDSSVVISRARIMPVGFAATVVGVGNHETLRGRHLAANVDGKMLRVFDVDQGSVDPIFFVPVHGEIEPQWIVDDRGESALAFVDSGNLFVHYPLSTHGTQKQVVPEGSRAVSLSRPWDKTYILVLGPDDRLAELFELNQGTLKPVTVPSGVRAVLNGPGQSVLVLSQAPDGRELRVSDVVAPDRPFFTMPLWEGEELRTGISEFGPDNAGSIVIVTNRTEYHISVRRSHSGN